MKIKYAYLFLIILLLSVKLSASDSTKNSSLELIKTISGKITPKSIVHNGNGLFFAQNMMYKHTVTVYNRDFELVHTLKDKINLSKFEKDTAYHSKEYHNGAPVECVFTHEGKYAWVSNYEMSGKGFNNPGCDNCRGNDKYDRSFVYKINTETFEIEKAIKVGSVPKFMASTKDNSYVLVSNWTSSDLSIIDTKTNAEIKRIKIGRFPRGIAIDNIRNLAYVTVMGSDKIAIIDLDDFSKSYVEVGKNPRHICIDEKDNILYATLNGEGKVAKINLITKEVEKLRTGKLPRSMDYCDYNKSLYVVNYGSKYLSKVDAITFSVTDTIETKSKPIGVTIDKESGEIWVACYSGSIMVIKDSKFNIKPRMGPFEMDLSWLKPTDKVEDVHDKIENISVIKKPKTSQPTKKYQIIVGSFSVKNNAIKLSKNLQKSFSNCHYFKHENGNYYVSINGFDSREKAKLFIETEKEKSNQFNGWILKN